MTTVKLSPEHVQSIAIAIRNQGNSPSADNIKLLTHRLVQAGIDKSEIDKEVLRQIGLYSKTLKSAVDKIKWNEIAIDFGADPKDIAIAVDVVDTTCCLFQWCMVAISTAPPAQPVSASASASASVPPAQPVSVSASASAFTPVTSSKHDINIHPPLPLPLPPLPLSNTDQSIITGDSLGQ